MSQSKAPFQMQAEQIHNGQSVRNAQTITQFQTSLRASKATWRKKWAAIISHTRAPQSHQWSVKFKKTRPQRSLQMAPT